MFCILIPWLASPLRIPGKSRMRKRARTDLCGGRPAMAVTTAILIIVSVQSVGARVWLGESGEGVASGGGGDELAEVVEQRAVLEAAGG